MSSHTPLFCHQSYSQSEFMCYRDSLVLVLVTLVPLTLKHLDTSFLTRTLPLAWLLLLVAWLIKLSINLVTTNLKHEDFTEGYQDLVDKTSPSLNMQQTEASVSAHQMNGLHATVQPTSLITTPSLVMSTASLMPDQLSKQSELKILHEWYSSYTRSRQ